MGCDIHTVVQHRVGDRWEVLALPDEWRDEYRDFPWEVRSYALFGVLAGVRDHDVAPIADPRGVPADAHVTYHDEGWGGSGDYEVDGHYLGEHSHSWVSLRELLEYDLTQWYSGQNGYGETATVGDVVDLSWAHQLATLGEPDDIRLVFGFDS